MTFPPLLLVAALATATPPQGAASTQPAVQAPGPAAAEAALPGVDLAGLTQEQKAAVLTWARDEPCYCGCPHTVSQCLLEHRSCKHAGRMAGLAVRLLRAGAKQGDLEKNLTAYYASFDKRARLDVSQFGPPLGSAAAPVAIVEFSDFTCPYCQIIRPSLEAFVKARGDRVKLFYKPFPIQSHPGALDVAQAAEWARGEGLFWPMHDAIFGDPTAHTPDALAELAREVGGDPAKLRVALDERRYAAKIRASQDEAKKAGIKGTPTLFMNGRMLVLGDFSEEGLEHALQDEEEWIRRGGWDHD
jgi:protein-disulfide isomerase